MGLALHLLNPAMGACKLRACSHLSTCRCPSELLRTCRLANQCNDRRLEQPTPVPETLRGVRVVVLLGHSHDGCCVGTVFQSSPKSRQLDIEFGRLMKFSNYRNYPNPCFGRRQVLRRVAFARLTTQEVFESQFLAKLRPWRFVFIAAP